MKFGAFAGVLPVKLYGQSGSSFGDTEATLIWKFSEERGAWPALAVEGEIKFPTARNRVVGTRKTDYAGYLVASHRHGALDTTPDLRAGLQANLGRVARHRRNYRSVPANAALMVRVQDSSAESSAMFSFTH